jgi:8-oxo-dGTP pyrophosphatase MutT (NUDIX family)
MYKVYVNGTPLFMGTPETTGDLGIIMSKTNFNAPYLGKKKQLKQYIDLLEKRNDVESVVLYSDNPEQLWADFKACFEWVGAAGGYVTNAAEQLLVFRRRGFWDMPKGKIDGGETPEQAAVREVQEETGLQQLQLGPLVIETWHTYQHKGERMLKQTWWYHMTTTDTAVTPQTEEDIEVIEWVEPKAWLATQPLVYASIKDVIETALNANKPL